MDNGYTHKEENMISLQNYLPTNDIYTALGEKQRMEEEERKRREQQGGGKFGGILGTIIGTMIGQPALGATIGSQLPF